LPEKMPQALLALLAVWATLAVVTGVVPLPSKMVGMYVLVADDSDKTYTSSYDWTPALHPYQQGAANTLFLTFINPDLMPAVPPAFANLARTRGTNAPGSVPSDVPIIFSVGGQEYSKETHVPSRKSYEKGTWAWLVSKERAEAMAAQVAQWPLKYGCDGIDLDIEDPAASGEDAEQNLVYFVSALKRLAPDMIITQPVLGSSAPMVVYDKVDKWDSSAGTRGPNRLIEAAYTKEADRNAQTDKRRTQVTQGAMLGSVSRVGIMVYSQLASLNFVDTYVHGCSPTKCSMWYCPLKACVPSTDVLIGVQGVANGTVIAQAADEVIRRDLGGMMVWYASLLNAKTGEAGLLYGPEDASAASLAEWSHAVTAMKDPVRLAEAKSSANLLRAPTLGELNRSAASAAPPAAPAPDEGSDVGDDFEQYMRAFQAGKESTPQQAAAGTSLRGPTQQELYAARDTHSIHFIMPPPPSPPPLTPWSSLAVPSSSFPPPPPPSSFPPPPPPVSPPPPPPVPPPPPPPPPPLPPPPPPPLPPPPPPAPPPPPPLPSSSPSPSPVPPPPPPVPPPPPPMPPAVRSPPPPAVSAPGVNLVMPTAALVPAAGGSAASSAAAPAAASLVEAMDYSSDKISILGDVRGEVHRALEAAQLHMLAALQPQL
jgi:hypothetical protein